MRELDSVDLFSWKKVFLKKYFLVPPQSLMLMLFTLMLVPTQTGGNEVSKDVYT